MQYQIHVYPNGISQAVGESGAGAYINENVQNDCEKGGSAGEERNLILSAFGTVGDPNWEDTNSPTTSTNNSAESHSSTLLAGVDQDGHRLLDVCRRSLMAYASRKPLKKKGLVRVWDLIASPVSTSAEAGQRGCLNNPPRV